MVVMRLLPQMQADKTWLFILHGVIADLKLS